MLKLTPIGNTILEIVYCTETTGRLSQSSGRSKRGNAPKWKLWFEGYSHAPVWFRAATLEEALEKGNKRLMKEFEKAKIEQAWLDFMAAN